MCADQMLPSSPALRARGSVRMRAERFEGKGKGNATGKGAGQGNDEEEDVGQDDDPEHVRWLTPGLQISAKPIGSHVYNSFTNGVFPRVLLESQASQASEASPASKKRPLGDASPPRAPTQRAKRAMILTAAPVLLGVATEVLALAGPSSPAPAASRRHAITLVATALECLEEQLEALGAPRRTPTLIPQDVD